MYNWKRKQFVLENLGEKSFINAEKVENNFPLELIPLQKNFQAVQ